MTIYTPSLNEKDSAKDKLVPEVVAVTEPLKTDCNDEFGKGKGAAYIPVTVVRRRGVLSSSYYRCLIFVSLIVLACGVTGGVFFYRHMTRKTYAGKCGTTFYDSKYHKIDSQPQALPMKDESSQAEKPDFVEEDIKVSEFDMIEELHTPSFDEVMETFVLHEFNRNFTSIVDKNRRRCFVMNLDRAAIAPPPAVVDLLKKLMDGITLPRARVARDVYVSTFEAMVDLDPMGPRIVQSCRLYPTFWIEKKSSKDHFEDFLFGNSPVGDDLNDLMYAMMSNQMDNPTVFKLNIKPLSRGKRPAAPAA